MIYDNLILKLCCDHSSLLRLASMGLAISLVGGTLPRNPAPSVQSLERPQHKVLPVVITDLKLDDNLFISLAHIEPHFGPPDIIVSGLRDARGGATNTKDFLNGFFEEERQNRIILSRPQEFAAGHEITFIPEDARLKTMSLSAYLKEIEGPDVKVVMFQIGQMEADSVHKIIEHLKTKILTFIMIDMYNADQKNDREETKDWLNQLQKRIRVWRPKAPLLYSDNVISFDKHLQLGSNIPFEKLLDYVPLDHLTRAINDPYKYKQIFEASAVLSGHSKEDLKGYYGPLASAIYELGRAPDFKLTIESDSSTPSSKTRMKAAPILIEYVEELYRMGSKNLLIDLAARLKIEVEKDKKIGKLFIHQPHNSEGVLVSHKGREIMRTDEGAILKHIVTSASLGESNIGTRLRQELLEFVNIAVPLLRAVGRSYLAEQMDEGIRRGLKGFCLEACDGLHGAVLLNILYANDDIETELEKISDGLSPNFQPINFMVDTDREHTRAKILKSGSKEEVTAFILVKGDEHKPFESLLEYFDRGAVPKKKVIFKLAELDPLGSARTTDTMTKDPAQSKIGYRSSPESRTNSHVLESQEETNVETNFIEDPKLVDDGEMKLIDEESRAEVLPEILPHFTSIH